MIWNLNMIMKVQNKYKNMNPQKTPQIDFNNYHSK